MLIQMMTKGKPSQIANLKTKLEELEKAADEMYRSQQMALTLGNKVHEHMENLNESTLCEECHSQFTEKIEHICGRFDEELESGELSEELWAELEEMTEFDDDDDEESTDSVCGHAK